MPAAVTELKLTDGTVTADLVDFDNYSLAYKSWAPAVAQKKKSKAGGSPYRDVVEEIELIVRGSTAAVALANLEKLTELLDQAYEWKRGAIVDPVVMQVLIQGSSLAAAQEAAVLGPVDMDDVLQLPVTFNDMIHQFEIEGVTLRFLRRGELLGPTESESSSSSANPAILTASSFTDDLKVASPIDITIGGIYSNTNGGGEMTTLLTNAADKLLAQNAASSSSITVPGSSTFATGTDAGYLPSGDVRKLVPNSLGEHYLIHGNVWNSKNQNVRTFLTYLVCRNLSSTISYLVRVEWLGTGETSAVSRKRVIPAGKSTDPIIVPLQPVTLTSPGSSYQLVFEPSGTGGASEALHVNYTCVLGVDENGHAISIDFGNEGGDAEVEWVLEHGRLDTLRPTSKVQYPSSTLLEYPTPRGNPAVYMKGQTVAALPFGVTAGASNGYYTLTEQVGAASIISTQITDVTRQAATLSPGG